MKKIATLLTIGAAAFVLAGCSGSGINPTSASRVCSLAANVLQMNVGTANLFGGTGAAVVGTNVAVTYRQSASANCYAGDSGALVSTPTLTVPAALVGPAGGADAGGQPVLPARWKRDVRSADRTEHLRRAVRRGPRVREPTGQHLRVLERSVLAYQRQHR